MTVIKVLKTFKKSFVCTAGGLTSYLQVESRYPDSLLSILEFEDAQAHVEIERVSFVRCELSFRILTPQVDPVERRRNSMCGAGARSSFYKTWKQNTCLMLNPTEIQHTMPLQAT
ncbi:uncharacterized protein LOC106179594 [Lingula anatina]|uniref:Uncharacterized protein LOC106179594 n=1 Tax=Lingula anatina TaxID=7574 RepID=A0A1S3K919_LINAN|nr:uncharacterized protein LOC106179594 [Lingula anatina]|eukprot:XP_013418761.1 uncharacterized protein LOC106179594 [Lingula anatina]